MSTKDTTCLSFNEIAWNLRLRKVKIRYKFSSIVFLAVSQSVTPVSQSVSQSVSFMTQRPSPGQKKRSTSPILVLILLSLGLVEGTALVGCAAVGAHAEPLEHIRCFIAWHLWTKKEKKKKKLK